MAVVVCKPDQVVALDRRFEDLDDDQADDEDVIYGVLKAVLAGLPRTVAAKKYFETIKEGGFCFRKALVKLSVQELKDLGLPSGHAIQVLIKIMVGFKNSPNSSE
jgi:hypothetical protein